MANIQISTQPKEVNTNEPLVPAITLHHQVPAGPITYFAHAALFDTAGNEVQGVLKGNKSATGEAGQGGLDYEFANLTIAAPGQYYILVNIFDSDNGAAFLGQAKSDTITVV